EDPDYITGFAVTEHTAGTENWLASEDPKVGVRTTCRREGDRYVINGVKHFITNGGVAKEYGIACRNDLSKPAWESTTCFLIPANTSGFSIGKIENKMGQRLMLNGELILSDVTVPKQHRLGDEEKGAAVLIDLTCSTGICIAGAAVGLARAAYEAAVAYANERTSWGQPIIHHQAVAMLLADMKMDMEAARALTWKVAWSSDNKGRDFFSSAAAKVHCADMVQRVASNALQIFGGAGYMRDLPLEKYVRDARVMQIYDGTNQILRVGVGTALASQRR
ncbi:MAG: acyl-CoA dehydrogenase family protein, partial [Candidatus Bathyarchaeia archaeon]